MKTTFRFFLFLLLALASCQTAPPCPAVIPPPVYTEQECKDRVMYKLLNKELKRLDAEFWIEIKKCIKAKTKKEKDTHQAEALRLHHQWNEVFFLLTGEHAPVK